MVGLHYLAVLGDLAVGGERHVTPCSKGGNDDVDEKKDEHAKDEGVH